MVVIGNFDGVHRGHRAVIRHARRVADERHVPLVAVTFDPHPMAVLRPEHAPSVLSDVADRASLLGDAGVDAVLALPFDIDTAGWSPAQFVDAVLVEGLRAGTVVVGAKFRFGKRAAGDVAMLRDLGISRCFDVETVVLEGGPQVWSSTYVRTCLTAGDISGATEALGRPFAVRGVVVEGDRRGRELGFPTANVRFGAASAGPADGVYAGWLTRLDTSESWPAAISVGTNPTFEGARERRVESYVLDRNDLDLYGVEVDVAFVDRLRGMVAFDSIDALVRQMVEDVDRARHLVGPQSLQPPSELAEDALLRVGA